MGCVPLSIKDREQLDAVPNDQIQFLSLIVMSCAKVLIEIFPNTIEYYENLE